MDHRVIGTTMPVLEIMLQPGETIVAEPGELSWISGSVQMKTSTMGAGAKGVLGVFKRVFAGGGLFMTEYSSQGGPGMVAFATKLPGQILPVDVAPGSAYLIHRGGFVCATPGIEI
ncbi:MAG TPA: AIM24 family protein, partial [Candidatus Eremiobacteraceae bacterium]|nr:AIM24 family protein [Candidatus Eremiobacteraceae bacterium]